jgi:hypothetical protein
MKTNEIDINRKHWNDQQQVLRRLLMKDKNYPEALPIFLDQHGMVHSAGLQVGVQWSLQDEVLDGLAEDQMRAIPKGSSHSIAWMLWHIARIEDVTMNLLLAGSPQVFHSQNWPGQLGVAYVGVGNELSVDEDIALGNAIHVKALLAYRLAVGRRTRELIQAIDPDKLWEFPTPEGLRRIVEEGAVGGEAVWLLGYWGGHPNANLLLMPATRHCFVHLNEAQRMSPKLRRL